MPRRLRLRAQLVDPVEHLDGFLGQVVAAEPSRAVGGAHLADLGGRAADGADVTIHPHLSLAAIEQSLDVRRQKIGRLLLEHLDEPVPHHELPAPVEPRQLSVERRIYLHPVATLRNPPYQTICHLRRAVFEVFFFARRAAVPARRATTQYACGPISGRHQLGMVARLRIRTGGRFRIGIPGRLRRKSQRCQKSNEVP